MNNINTIDKSNNPKPNSWRNLWYVLMLAGLLNTNSPTCAQTNDYNNTTTEQVTPQTNTLNWIKLPTVYQNKLDEFLANNTVMKDNDAKNYTLNFVEKEMESDRWISKENQLLFIRHAIYKQVTDQNLYDWQDGNQKLAEDFSNKAVSIRIRACGQKYRNWIITYMNGISAEARQQSAEARQQSAEARQQSAEARQQSAEARQQSAEARQQSAEARQQSAEAIKETMKLDSIRISKNLQEFYDMYSKNPNIIKQEEINFMKKRTKEVIFECKKYWINYRAILLKEVWWDAKKVDEILKFYGIE